MVLKIGDGYGLDFVLVLFCESPYGLGLVDSLVLYSLIRASKSILFIDQENIPKTCKSYAWYACFF